MKVYVKKKEKNPMLPGVFITVLFLTISVFIFYQFFTSDKPFIDKLSSFGTTLLFAIVFFGFSVFFIFYLLKRPKAYKMTLVKKKLEKYNGMVISYMKFSSAKIGEYKTKKEEEDNTFSYNCFTIGDNDLVEGKEYALRVKEYNWQPKSVEKIDAYSKLNEESVVKSTPKKSLSLVFLGVGIIFGGMLLLCILGMILYPKYIVTYLVVALFNIGALYKIYIECKKK